MSTESKEIWLGFGKTVLSAIVGAVAVIFFLGGREAKINDLVSWKTAISPKIDRMDTTGTLSFDLFHQEYLRTQARQEETMKEMQKEIRELERERK